jgi:DNA-binding response OmpR family regulator
MAEISRILLADDEKTFLMATATFLEERGFNCDSASSADEAIEKLKAKEYDLLISDIKMPGNPDLELIRQLPKIADGLPVILITGYPSQKSAIDSIQLPVVAYLVKPFDYEQLLEEVNAATEKSRLQRAVANTKKRLEFMQNGLADLEDILKDEQSTGFSASMKNFLDMTFSNVHGSLSDIKHMSDSMTSEEVKIPVCHLLNCPKLTSLEQAIEHAINILEKTKSSFKSKELGSLRKHLKGVLKNGDSRAN